MINFGESNELIQLGTLSTMTEKPRKIPASQDELMLYCVMGEALCKTQIVEQALSCSITIKMNPAETKEHADEFLKRQQRYTLGAAITIAKNENLYNPLLQQELFNFLAQRNWLVHQAMAEGFHDLKMEKEAFVNKIKDVSNTAEALQSKIQYDMIQFASSQGKDMSKILALLELEKQGIRVQL